MAIDFLRGPRWKAAGAVAVVGRLERVGRRPVNGFRVDKGDHGVDLRVPDCETRRESVTLGPSRIAVLIADLEERTMSGRPGCYVFFR